MSCTMTRLCLFHHSNPGIMLLFGIITHHASGIFVLNVTVPLRGSPVRANCTLPGREENVYILFNSSKTLPDRVQCNPNLNLCVPVSYPLKEPVVYKFWTGSNSAWIDILSLDRIRDQAIWRCSLGNQTTLGTIDLNVFTSPKGVKHVPPILPDRDLGQESVTLICETDNCAYPAPQISWYYHNNLQQKVRYNVSDGVMVNNTTPCDQLEAIYTSTLHLARGTTFQGNNDFKTKFACAVQHLALDVPIIYSEFSNYVTFAVNLTMVTLKDMHDNALPSTMELVQGSVVILKCVTSTSRPTATVRWYIGSTNILSGIENVAKPGDNGLEFMESNLTFTPNNEHHNKYIYCQAYSSVNSSFLQSTQHMLFVIVQVPNITLLYDTSAAVGSILPVVNGTSITLRCETGSSRPASIIMWYKGNVPVQDGVISRNETNGGFDWVVSTLTFTPSINDHEMELFCQGYNIDPRGTVTSTKALLNVTVYVSSVTLIPGNSSITFLEGDQMIVKCVTSPSRPRPQIRWWVGNEIKTNNMKESISNSGNLIIIESEITLMLNRSYRNRLLFCDTQVPEQGTWISSFKSQINVWYPPSVPAVLAYGEGFPWLENGTGILECNISEPGNPAASVTWTSARGKPDGHSHLILENLTASDNGLAVKCNLSNNFTVLMHLVVESLVRNLEVEYTPKIRFVPNHNRLTVNETRDLNVTCISDGNPTPSVEWSNINSSNVLYMRNISRHDSRTYVCIAKSNSTNYGRIPLQSQKQLQLTVQFAPEMSLKVTPSIVEVNSEVRIECSAHGEPSSYKFYDWIHKLGNVKLRHIEGIVENQSISAVRLPNITIEDMGTYICSVDNGITGPNGGIVQSVEAQIDVAGVPVAFVRDTFFRDINMPASIKIPFFSYPNITAVEFFRTQNNTPVANDTDTQVYHTEANISTFIHNTDVVLQGMEAVLDFKSLKDSDFGQYTLVLSNNKGNATLSVHLNASAPPSPVKQFYFYRLLEKYMEFYFVPGFNGGYQQTFTIQFKPSRSLDESWKNTSVNGLSEMDDTYRLPNGTFLVQVEKLQPGSFVFRMFSVNEKNIRTYSQEVPVYIEAAGTKLEGAVIEMTEPGTDATIGLSISAIAGGIGGALVIILVTGVVIFLWRRHNHTNNAADDDLDQELEERERPESGLVDNPVYEKSNPRPGESGSMDATRAMYATMVKPKNKVPMVEDPKNLYSQVEKTKKMKSKKGEIYENAYLPKKRPNQEDVYENSRQIVNETSAEHLYEDSGASVNVLQVNNGGLLYADLKLDLPTIKNGKHVIYGLENRTEYAEIDYGKRGDPIPDNNDEEDGNGVTK